MTTHRPVAWSWSRSWSLALALATAGCASHTVAPPHDALAARFATPDAQRALALAPDLYARADRAHADAQHSDDDGARADHEVRAQLLLEAAIAEAARIGLERDAAAVDARADQLLEQRADLERQRVDLEQAAGCERAAQTAGAEAARALQITSPRGKSNAARDQTATFVRDRATLTLAAAIALGLDATRADALERAIAQAQRAPTSAARVTTAKRVLEQVLSALDATRTARTPQ